MARNLRRKVKYIVVHCTGTSPHVSVDAIRRYWKEQKGWKSPGYHIIVEKDGIAHILEDFEKITNGVKGHNSHSIHIAYVGGINEFGHEVDTRTDRQVLEMANWIRFLKQEIAPKAKILGHRDLSPDRDGDGQIEAWEWIKDCPCFDAKAEYAGF